MPKLIQIVGGLVTVAMDRVTVLVDTLRDEVSIIREEGEEYTIGKDGERIVARPPVVEKETPGARGCAAPLLGGTEAAADPRAAELAERRKKRNGLTEYIESQGGEIGRRNGGGQKKPSGPSVLRQWMLMKGKSQAEVARGTGLHQGTVSPHATGKKTPPRETAERYAKFFEMSVEEFLKGPGKDPQSPKASAKEKNEMPAGEPTVNSLLVVVAPTVKDDICELCRAENGDVSCGNCDLTRAVRMASNFGRKITAEVKDLVCMDCSRRERGMCGICYLGMAVRATEDFLKGMTPGEAAVKAMAEREAEMERVREEQRKSA